MPVAALLRPAALVALAVLAGPAVSATQCIEFAWDVKAEHLLFAMQPRLVTAGTDRASTPTVDVDRLYAVQLQRQSDVHFDTAPGARDMHPDGYGGMVRLQVAVPGAYRVSADQPVWIDVAFNGALLKPQDFQARRDCHDPHKIVEFVLPMGVQLTLQFSNAASGTARIAITPTTDGPH